MEPSTFVLPANLALTALALVTSGIAINFQIRRDRLPAATCYENISELAAQAERLLAERRAELSIVEQKIQQRDRLVAEVASLEEQRNVIRAELASLETARREIEEVKAEAASVAAELATVKQECDAKRAELEALKSQLDPKKLEDMRQEIEKLSQEKASLDAVVPDLRAERDAAMLRIEEARTLQARLAAQEALRDRLEAEIEELDTKRQEVRDYDARLASLRDQISGVSDALRKEQERHSRLTTAITTLVDQHAQFEAQIAELDQHRGELETNKAELAQTRQRHGELSEEIAHLMATKARLAGEVGGGGAEPQEEAQLLSDLVRFPMCLEAPNMLRGVPRDENAALHDVSTYLKMHGLDYHSRTVHAFHTALKINDNSQLTVLAGVSGTGKSLLPRRYAEAMGIHFLQIAVEPRWDSPQDLLGFYNYIEKKYRATDLARLLVHMDPFSSLAKGESAKDREDHMSLVLLDEMNLARVEYYFSEFLSRLEVRPRYAEVTDSVKRNDAMIPIDIRGLKKSIALFPSHNVLFAGTMNDDESTQALSDKVLDRGNVLQFAAPKKFDKPKLNKAVPRPDQAQSFASWRTWVRPPDTLADATRTSVEKVIADLAVIMENCGRPFGHRLRDSILSYVASYPQHGHNGPDVDMALADQIECRIMPKLRGIELDTHQSEFDKLQGILRDRLQDSVFADRLGELREKQTAGTGLFVWRGLAR